MERIVQKLNSPLPRRKSGFEKLKIFGVPIKYLRSNSASVPKIITNLCEFLLEYGLNTEGIFRVNGSSKVIASLKAEFDTTSADNLDEPDFHDIHAVCGVFKLFLREIPDGLIPESITKQTTKMMERLREDKHQCSQKLKQMLTTIPTENYDLVKYLCNFLRKFVLNECHTKMTASNMGIVFGPCIFKCCLGMQGLRQQNLSNLAVTYFIAFYDDIFNSPASNILNSQKNVKTPSVSSLFASTKRFPENTQQAPPPPSLPPRMRQPRSHLSIEQLSSDPMTHKTHPMTPRGDASPSHTQSTTNLIEAALFWSRRWCHSGLQSPSSACVSLTAPAGNSDESSFFSPSRGKSKSKESLNASHSNVSETDSITSHGMIVRELATIMTSIIMPTAKSDSHSNLDIQSPAPLSNISSSSSPPSDFLTEATSPERSCINNNCLHQLDMPYHAGPPKNSSSMPSLVSSDPTRVSVMDDDVNESWKMVLLQSSSNSDSSLHHHHQIAINDSSTMNIFSLPQIMTESATETRTLTVDVDEMVKTLSSTNDSDVMTYSEVDFISKLDFPIDEVETGSSLLSNDRRSSHFFPRSHNYINSIEQSQHYQVEDVASSFDQLQNTEIEQNSIHIAKTLDLVYAETRTIAPIEVNDLAHCDDIPSPVKPLIDLINGNVNMYLELTSRPLIHSASLNNSKLIRISTWPGKRNICGKLQNRHSLDVCIPSHMLQQKTYTNTSLDSPTFDRKIVDRPIHLDLDVTATPKIRIVDNEEAILVGFGVGESGIFAQSPTSTSTTTSTVIANDVESLSTLILAALTEQRILANRSDKIEEMNHEELLQEKIDLQRSLLYFERIKGRPQDSQSKRIMKPLYDRYRAVRRLVRSNTIIQVPSPTPHLSTPLFQRSPPAVDTAEDRIDQNIPEPSVSESSCLLTTDEQCSDQTASTISLALKTDRVTENPVDYILNPHISLSEFSECSREMSRDELVVCRSSLLSAKHRLQRGLHDFEQQIQSLTNRPPLKRDRDERRADYNRYRDLKQRLFVLDEVIKSPETSLEILVSTAQAVGRCHRRKVRNQPTAPPLVLTKSSPSTIS